MCRKLYILVRRDLSKSQQAVQGGHAVAEYLLRGPSTDWSNGTLVYLSVRDENELKFWGTQISKQGYAVVQFREPDRDNEITAIATECDDMLLDKLRLL